MEELTDVKVAITVDGKNIHNGDPLFCDITVDKVKLVTKVGKTNVQDMEIIIERGVYPEIEEENKDD